jgi:hypothetical protein
VCARDDRGQSELRSVSTPRAETRDERAAALASIDTCLGLRELGRPQRFFVHLLRASVLTGPRRQRAIDAAEALAETEDERAEIAALRK